MKKAIVTLVIGKKYEKMFNTYCRKNWQTYCEKYNYELIVINKNLDDSKRSIERSPSWQKLLILSQPWANNYDQIVWVDSDILINNQMASDITLKVEKKSFGAVDAYSIPSEVLNYITMKRQYNYFRENNIEFIDNLKPGQYYENRGIPGGNLNQVVQAGVFVCSQHHREIFEHVYYTYEDTNKTAAWNYEMPAFSYELINSTEIKWLPVEYNYCVQNIIAAYYPFVFLKKDLCLKSKFMQKLRHKFPTRLQIKCLEQIYNNGYFIHFAGCQTWIRQFKAIK